MRTHTIEYLGSMEEARSFTKIADSILVDGSEASYRKAYYSVVEQIVALENLINIDSIIDADDEPEDIVEYLELFQYEYKKIADEIYEAKQA